MIDSVQLSPTQSAIFEPAAHLERAGGEYFSLVHTHPTERDEFSHGVRELQGAIADILYGGRWPEPEEMPALPGQARPGTPADNGGLTRSEQLISNDLVSIYRKTRPSANPAQHKRLVTAMHLCQSGLQSRVLRRDYPNYWMSTPGTLAQDAQREMNRWGQ